MAKAQRMNFGRYKSSYPQTQCTTWNSVSNRRENSCHQFIADQFLREYNNSQITSSACLTMLVSLMLYENNETDIQL